jgi:hypothetical protein
MQLLVRRIFPLAALVLVATAQIAQAGEITPFELNRVTIWSNGDKPGRLIGRGVVPEMALPIDASGGLVVNVTDADQLDILIEFDASDCHAVGPNRSICSKTVGKTKRQRVKIHNAGDGGIRFYFQNIDVQGPLTGPVTIRIDTTNDVLLGSNGSCSGGQRLLHCR